MIDYFEIAKEITNFQSTIFGHSMNETLNRNTGHGEVSGEERLVTSSDEKPKVHDTDG